MPFTEIKIEQVDEMIDWSTQISASLTRLKRDMTEAGIKSSLGHWRYAYRHLARSVGMLQELQIDVADQIQAKASNRKSGVELNIRRYELQEQRKLKATEEAPDQKQKSATKKPQGGKE
jgi:hypothetical protein